MVSLLLWCRTTMIIRVQNDILMIFNLGLQVHSLLQSMMGRLVGPMTFSTLDRLIDLWMEEGKEKNTVPLTSTLDECLSGQVTASRCKTSFWAEFCDFSFLSITSPWVSTISNGLSEFFILYRFKQLLNYPTPIISRQFLGCKPEFFFLFLFLNFTEPFLTKYPAAMNFFFDHQWRSVNFNSRKASIFTDPF